MRYASGDFLLPLVDIGFCLYLFLDVIRKFGEEIVAGDTLHLIYRVDEVFFLQSGSTLVATDKADGLRILAGAEDNLEESIRHHHLILTQFAMLLIQEYWTADDIDLTIFLSPGTALLFYAIPDSRIQSMGLRTHIGHQEAFVHSLLVPLVIASRTEMTSIITAVVVISLRSLRRWHIHIILKVATFQLS